MLLHRLLTALLIVLLTAGVSFANSVTLTYVSHTTAGLEDPNNRIYQQIFEEFMQAHPNIRVEMYFGGKEQVQVMMAGGQAPDATFLENWYLPAWQHTGMILPLDEYVTRDDYNLDEFFPFLVQLSRATDSRTGVEHLYALPRHPSPLAVYYNRDMFERSGLLTPDQISLDDWTYERMREDARRLTIDVNGNGQIDQFGMRSQDFQTVPHTLFPIIRAFGGSVIDEESLTPQINTPESVDAIRWIADLMWGVQVAPRPGESGTFPAGNVSMLTNIFGQTRNVIAQADFDWDFAYLPSGPAGRFNRSVAGTHVMLSSTEHPDETWLLLKWLASDRAKTLIAAGGSALPSRISTAAAIFDDPGPDLAGKNLRVFLDPLMWPGHPEPGMIEWDAMRAAVNNAMQPVWRGEAAPESAAAEAARLLEGILAEERALRTR